MRLSVIVPMLNEEHAIAATLAAIRRGAADAELIVVDGGSTDASIATARPFADRVIGSSRGRAKQMNAGAAAADGDALAFVHADSIVPGDFAAAIAAALSDPQIVGGRFDLELDERTPICRLIGRLISIRSRLSRTGTGDQALFVRRKVFERLGGFPDIALCEDLDFARRLKRAGRVACPRSRVITSARRWRRQGFARTILKMWTIRFLYLAGVPPARLVKMYSDVR